MAERLVKFRKIDRDRRVAEINGRWFEVVTCRNTRGNISGWGIFGRYPQPRPVPGSTLMKHGEWRIDPGQALFGECRDWLDALARGENPKDVSMFAKWSPTYTI